MTFGPTEMAVLVIFAIFLFGAKKIPELARNIGRAKGEFQAGVSEAVTPSKAEMDMDRGGMTEEIAAENE